MNSSIIHDDIYSFILKKYHSKSSHSDMNYHMTLNIIFSVVTMLVIDELVGFERLPVEVLDFKKKN